MTRKDFELIAAAPEPEPDFRVSGHGSIMILHLLSPAAQSWAAEHISDAAQGWGKNGIVVEPRFIENVVAGMLDAGLVEG